MPLERAKDFLKRGIRELKGEVKVNTHYPKPSQYATWEDGDKEPRIIKYENGFYGHSKAGKSDKFYSKVQNVTGC